MRERKEPTDGKIFADNVMGYLKLMYPDIMKQSRSFNTSLRNYMWSQFDMVMLGKKEPRYLALPVQNPRSPIETMIDKACGIEDSR